MAKNIKTNLKLLILPISFSVFSIATAQAAENGLGHYPVGVNTVAAGLLPTLGNAEVATYSLYSNDTYFAGNDGKGEVPGFDSSVTTLVPRTLYTLPKEIPWLNLPVTVGVVVPMVNLNLNTPGGHGHIFGIGDIDLETDVQLNAPEKGFFSYAGLVTYLPTGSYNHARIANLGLNYYTFHPQYAATWFVNRNLELDGTIAMSFNTKNTATDYHSGAQAYGEYAANYRIMPNTFPSLYLGVQGFAQKQIQDDTKDGSTYENGFKAQAFGIGPQVTYYMFHNKGGFILKYIHEYAVRNQAHGDQVWLEFAVPVG